MSFTEKYIAFCYNIIYKMQNTIVFTSFLGDKNCSSRTSVSSKTMGSGLTLPSLNSVICTPLDRALWGLSIPGSICKLWVIKISLPIQMSLFNQCKTSIVINICFGRKTTIKICSQGHKVNNLDLT